VEPHGVQHAAVSLPVGGSPVRRGRSVRQGIGKRRIAQRIMEPPGAEPAALFLAIGVHRVSPAFQECDDAARYARGVR